MFLTAHPDRGRSDEEKLEVEAKYKPGDDVLPKIDAREKTTRERRMEDEDRRLVHQVQAESLREVGVETPEERRERRRRREERARLAARSTMERESSRDTSLDRVMVIRESRRRGAAESSGGEAREGRRRRMERQEGSTTSLPTVHPGPAREDRETRRRRERSAEEAAARRQDQIQRRNDEANRTAARQIEHQSSLRSLIGSSDVDTQEVEEEILRQIRDEGLLDGIDVENIDADQESHMSQRIAEAFRRRREELTATVPLSAAAQFRTRERSASTRAERRSEPANQSPARLPSHYPPRTEHRRAHARSLSSTRQPDEVRRLGPRTGSHLQPHSSDEGSTRRRSRETSRHSRRSATSPTPSASPNIRAMRRSQTEITDHSSGRPAEVARARPSAEAPATSEPTPGVLPSSASMADVVSELAASQRRRQPSSLPPRSQPTRIAAELEDWASPTELDASARPYLRNHSQSNAVEMEAPHQGHARATSQNSVVHNVAAVPSTPTQPSSHLEPYSILEPVTPPTTALHSSAIERAMSLSAASRPTSSSSAGSNHRNLARYPEPSISCNRCRKQHIEYRLHYSCSICLNGTYNLCLSCYRRGLGCLHWFGFGDAAFSKFSKMRELGQLGPNPEPPHMLYAERYVPPTMIPGGAEGRRTLTTEDPVKRLQSGAFCAGCEAWANECFWRCDICNEGDWGFCNSCVNRGQCCSHALLPLLYAPDDKPGSSAAGASSAGTIGAAIEDEVRSPVYAHPPPTHASLLQRSNAAGYGAFKPLSFKCLCDICHLPIQPQAPRYHCYECSSALTDGQVNREVGDYDICDPCYRGLVQKRRISAENGHQGWRRCLRGHRMVVLAFEDLQGGQRRVVLRDLVGGWELAMENVRLPQSPATMSPPLGSASTGGVEVHKWSWAPGTKARLVSSDVAVPVTLHTWSALQAIPGLTNDFPLDGGSGMCAVAMWSWWPSENEREGEGELAFPRGAQVGECVDVNTDWFFGSYMGRKGLFPAPYVRVLK